MTDEEYLLKYQEKYGKLDNKGKEYVLKCKKEADNMTDEESQKIFEGWIDFEFSSNKNGFGYLED
jgi:hypothetical protein